jgi:hypothetical protein
MSTELWRSIHVSPVAKKASLVWLYEVQEHEGWLRKSIAQRPEKAYRHAVHIQEAMDEADIATTEKDKRIKELERAILIENARMLRIIDLEVLLDQAIAVFDKYLNVPEATEVKARWAELKAKP